MTYADAYGESRFMIKGMLLRTLAVAGSIFTWLFARLFAVLKYIIYNDIYVQALLNFGDIKRKNSWLYLIANLCLTATVFFGILLGFALYESAKGSRGGAVVIFLMLLGMAVSLFLGFLLRFLDRKLRPPS